MATGRLKKGIEVHKVPDGFNMWAFGINYIHEDEEKYIFVKGYKWDITIGKYRTFIKEASQYAKKQE